MSNPVVKRGGIKAAPLYDSLLNFKHTLSPETLGVFLNVGKSQRKTPAAAEMPFALSLTPDARLSQ
jgi:hypothetical protein